MRQDRKTWRTDGRKGKTISPPEIFRRGIIILNDNSQWNHKKLKTDKSGNLSVHLFIEYLKNQQIGTVESSVIPSVHQY